MLNRLAATVTGRRSKWIVVAVWLVLLAVFAPLGSRLPDVATEEYSRPSGSQSAEIGRLLGERFREGDTTPAVLVYRREGGLTGADRRAIVQHASKAVGLPLVRAAVPPFGQGAGPGQVSADGDVAFTVLPMVSGGVTETTRTVDRLRAIAAPERGLEAHLTGTTPLFNDLTNIIQEADLRLLVATGLLVLVLLMAIYRSPLLAVLPLTVVGVSYAIATGVLYLLADAGMTVSSNSITLLLVLMFGVGTDYCLLLVNRYSSKLRGSEDHHLALAAAVPRAAPAIIASGFTVIAALLALLASLLALNRAFAPVTAAGVVIVLAASLTLFPALLAIFGRAVFWPGTHRVEYTPGVTEESGAETVWARLGRRVLRRPRLALTVSVLALGAGSLGLLTYESDAQITAQFRTKTDGVRGYEVLRSAFPGGAAAPTVVLVERRGGAVAPADVEAVHSRLIAVPGVSAVSRIQSRSRDGSAVTLSLVFGDNPYGNPALARVALLRERTAGLAPDLRVLFGEGTANRLDFRDASERDLRVIAPLALAVIFVLLVLLLRAVIAPIYLIGTVVLSYFGTLGLALLIFKHAFGRPSVDPELPLIAFIFIVALGSDYNIFLMHRVREESSGRSTREGVLRALAATGSVITSAGIILAGTFCVLAVLPVNILLEIGIAVALGVLLDTFVVRTVVVPALVWVVGERSWWPFRPPGRAPTPEIVEAA